MFLVVVAALFAHLNDPSVIDEEAEREVEAETPEEREQGLRQHEYEVAEATRADIEDGYSGK